MRIDSLRMCISRRSVQRTVLPTLALALALAVGVAAMTSSNASAQAPKSAHRAAACTKTPNVIILVYQFFSEPTSNGCWSYNRIYQNAGQGANTWKICHGDGSVQGSGANRIFDDTSPGSALSTETSRINACGNLYAEFAARRPQNGENWCSNHGYSSPCWRRNAGTVVSVSRYGAETYSSDNAVSDYWSTWAASGNGASPSNSFPTLNIRPDVWNNTFNTNVLASDILFLCNNGGSTLGIYAGAGSGSQTTSQTDVNTISNALNACTTS
jgi:hypothetical protein